MDFWENIESYINNDLSETERKVFEKAMSTDAALRQSVDEQRLLINLLRQNKGSNANNGSLDDVIKRKRLKGIIDCYIAKLPDAPVEMPEKEENTEGVKIVPLNPKPFKEPPISEPSRLIVVKKTNIWWAVAASLAVVATAGIWWFQHNNNTPIPVIAEKPNTPVLIDSVKNVPIPKPEERVVAIQPKVTPQYQTPKKPQREIPKQENIPIASPVIVENPEARISDAVVFEEVKMVLEAEKIESPSRGANEIEAEFKAVINLLLQKNTNEALTKLENLNGNRAQLYRAITYLMIDRTKGKSALEELVKETAYSDKPIHKKAKDLLEKLK